MHSRKIRLWLGNIVAKCCLKTIHKVLKDELTLVFHIVGCTMVSSYYATLIDLQAYIPTLPNKAENLMCLLMLGGCLQNNLKATKCFV